MKYVFVLLAGVMLLFACRFIGGKRVRGNGNMVTDERTLSSFDGVASFGSFDVMISSGATHSVKVEAEENLQDLIETEVEGNRLVIKTRRGYNIRPRREIKISVTAPNFSSLETNGSGNIIGENLINSEKHMELELAGSGNIDVDVNAPGVSAGISGSGNISVSGTAKEFKSSIRGSGNIKARDLKTEDCKVEIAGSGNVDVFASNSLDVHIMGSGGVNYRGDAKIKTSIAGSGSVNRVD